MERTNLKHSKILELESCLNLGDLASLNRFWDYIKENGAPLVEDIEDDSHNALVSIVYKENKPLNNVVLIPPVGMRKLENCVLDKIEGTNLWYISYKVPKDICFNYQFSPSDPLNNDWNRRWKNVQGDEFNKTSLKYIDNLTGNIKFIPFVEMKNAKKRIYIHKRDGVKEGKLHEHSIFSNILNEERKFSVYVPNGYEQEQEPMGVLVLNDGFEYLNMLNATCVLDNLMTEGKIPKMVAVFVESTDKRADNLKCSKDYADFIAKEIMQYVFENYNISKDSSKNVIGGYSLGGLFSSYMALNYPDIFGNVLSQSGSYWYKEDKYSNEKLWIINEFEKVNKLNLKFYINVGSIEPKVSMIDTNKTFNDYLIAKGYNTKFEKFPSGHDYWYWGETLANGLIYLLS